MSAPRTTCIVERRALIQHGTLDPATGSFVGRHEEWVTRPCGTPLFSRGKDGVCESCLKGWTHEHNYATEAGLATIEAARKS